MKSHINTLILLICLAHMNIRATPPINYNSLKFVQISTSSGLPYPVTREIAQDSLGFIWITTQTNVYRFDGIHYHEYKVDASDPYAIGGEDSEAILTDSKGRIWIGSKGYLHRHIPKEDKFNRWYVAHYSSNSRAYQIVNYLAEDTQQNIWIGSSASVLKVIENPDSLWVLRFKSYPLITPEGKLSVDIRYLFTDNNKILWATSDNGLFYYNEQTDSFHHYKNPELGSKSTQMACYNTNGDAWIGAGNELYLISNLDTNYHLSTTHLIARDMGSVNSLLLDWNHGLWIGTTKGLFVKPPTSDVLIQYTNNPSPNSLINNIITDIYLDDEGLIWIGTRKGISIFDPYRFKFELYSNSDYKYLNQLYGITEDNNQHTWFASNAFGISVFNARTRQMANISHPNDQTGLFFDIVHDRKNTFWLSGYGELYGGLYRMVVDPKFYENYNPANISFTRFEDLDNETKKNRLAHIKGLTLASDSLLYLTGRGIGIGKVILQNNKPVSYSYVHNKSYSGKEYDYANNTSCLLIDSTRGIWVGCRGIGAWLYNPKTDSIKNYEYNPGINEPYYGISDRGVSCIIKDTSNRVWLGTFLGGLNLYIDSTDNFRHFTVDDGLPSNTILTMELNNEGQLWISTNKGLCMFNPTTYECETFNEFDGIQGLDFAEYSHEKLRSGEIIFGGTNGFNIIPNSTGSKHLYKKPKVVFTELYVNYKEVAVGSNNAKGNILTSKLWNTQQIRLNPKQNNFQVHFAATSYSRPLKIRYKYKLENYNQDWIETNYTTAFASYNNLPGGTYIFKVKAANADGEWNDTPTELRIIITPKLTERISFWVLLSMLILGIVVLFFYMRTRAIQNKRKELEQLVHERTEEIEEQKAELEAQTDQLKEYNTILHERQSLIEEQSEELITQNEKLQGVIQTKDKLFSIIAHDLKNPFNTIMGFAELLEQRFEKYDDIKKLSLIHQIYNSTAIIYRLLENLLLWSRSQRGAIEFAPAHIELRILVADVFSLLKEPAERKKNELINEIPPELTVYADNHLLDTVLRNLVNNAIKFTEHGTVIVTAYIDNNDTIIAVSDTGIGIPPDIKDNIFKKGARNTTTHGTQNETGTGLGLLICHEFIEYHNGKIWAESEIGKGTSFFISLPNK